MLRRFTAKSFKSLYDVEIELGRVNVFVGANGSGKSNLLEALGLLGAAAAGRVDDEALLRRGVRPGAPELYKASFSGQDAGETIRFGAENDDAVYRVGLRDGVDGGPWQFESESVLQAAEPLVEREAADAATTLDPAAGLAALEAVRFQPGSSASRLLSDLREFAIYAPNTPTLRGLVPDPQSRLPVGLHGGNLARAVEDLRNFAYQHVAFEDVIDDLLELMEWVEDFGAKSSDAVPMSASIPTTKKVLFFRDRFMADGRNELTAYDASEGVLYALFAAVLAAHSAAPKLLAIDNVDTGLNPRLLRRLMENLCVWTLAQGNKQLLLTCHNPLILDGLPLQNDQVRLFAVDRSDQGRTHVRRVELSPELSAKAGQGWPLSRLWVQGHLGGVPNI